MEGGCHGGHVLLANNTHLDFYSVRAACPLNLSCTVFASSGSHAFCDLCTVCIDRSRVRLSAESPLNDYWCVIVVRFRGMIFAHFGALL